jgi:hypothetical protein
VGKGDICRITNPGRITKKNHMKYLVQLSYTLALLLLFADFAGAQNKKNIVSVKAHTKVNEKGFGSPQSISEVKDVLENNEAYNALKKLIEDDHVIMVYAGNSFMGNANLKRGDFVVSFNSALGYIKEATKNAGLDTSLINTYDRNKAYITSVTQVKDIQPGSVYYNAVQSLLEEWGINAPFTKAALLNANSLFYEDELYDILRVTLGFEYGHGKPGKVAVKRSRFAIMLNDALTLKMQQVEVLASEKKSREDAEKSRVNAIIKQIEQNHRDSVSKEIEMRKAEAEKKEAEARKQLEEKKK